MNLVEMMKLSERVYEFRDYMRSFYHADYDPLYDVNFTDDEIIEGISEYIKDKKAYKGIMEYGADTVDRERVAEIIFKMREKN